MPLGSASSLASAFAASFAKQQALKSGDLVHPKITSALADDLGKDYAAYAKPGKASGAGYSGGSGSDVAGGLKGKNYMKGWEDGLKAYWGAATFDDGSGKYITGAKATTSKLNGTQAAVDALLPDPAGTQPAVVPLSFLDFSTKLATVLDTWTKKIEVPTDDDNSAKSAGPTPTSPVPKVS